jgi:peptide/nickel transport system substrate-binding protein
MTFDWRRAAMGSVLGLTLLGVAAPRDARAGEAPMFADQVKAGKLPALNDRLPAQPYVETPFESVGKYGGTWRMAVLGGGDDYNFVRAIANENLMRWTPDWKHIQPNIAQSVDVNPDATEFTFHLRPGMKWSDGAPFGADDIMFWYEDVFSNPQLTATKPPIYTSGGDPVKVEKKDDATVVFRFTKPYGLFLQQLANGFGEYPTLYPKHYLQQFHIKYNKDGIAKLLAADPSAKDWVQLFNSKISPNYLNPYWQNVDLPTLNPWVMTNKYGSVDRVVAVRNPYYWKVDTAGNQLPYIDRVTWDQVNDVQLALLKAINGEIDYQLRHIGQLPFKSTLYDNQERGKYHFFTVWDHPANDAVLLFNFNVADPIKQKVFRDKNFRIGVSYAIDRQEIIDSVYVGQGTAAQVAVRKGNPLYNERLANQYVEHDLTKAAAYLDKAGLDKKDSDGYRLGPDGKRFSVVFMVADVYGLQYPDVIQLVQRQLKEVGLDLQIRTTDWSRLTAMQAANEQEAYIWNCVGGESDVYTDPRCYLPFQTEAIFYARKWAEWYADHTTGEAPPEDVQALMALYDKVNAAVDDAGREVAMKKFLEASADEFFVIGIIQGPDKFGIVKNNMKNVYQPLPQSGSMWGPAPMMAQMYFDQ